MSEHCVLSSCAVDRTVVPWLFTLTFVLGQHLAQAEGVAVHPLQVVLLQSLLNHLGGLILTRQLGKTHPQGVIMTSLKDKHEWAMLGFQST